MAKWLSRLMQQRAPTPEKAATSMLVNARMQLFTAEQRVIDANIQLEYWRARVLFLEDVQTRGIQPSASVVPKVIADFGSGRTIGPRLATGK
ncbi:MULTISPECIES: hypothetical protein [Paraburkholderia]|uniref:Outer membrane efflux protein n=2 Tax=Paraburkholderia TaxID=1822464 RepID=A0A1I3P394_9BURK|nr:MULTISPECIES: hypothetical protein [Paraburkholderia]MCX4165917.1 hypothetical protein [Paraburkholderia megapolitana]MDN7161408.1 hypothetical protein [Paraburkholderia sp. CHISQ3]MDQ6498455.1 hypothetical protein [Paraburkholderia megapolitana]PCE27573.1 hypothetical protein BWP39_03450 [Paraburkholderia acidicola]QDQ84583.1 hypothetical protein FNZ07_26285 [Paraburkholderia megapolitana]